MDQRVFSNGLVVKHRKSAIIFENLEGKKEKEDSFSYFFEDEEFKHFVSHIEKIANEAWINIVPKEAKSYGADYFEYYDRKYDDNGYLKIMDKKIIITAPYWSVDTLYQFNKPKIQSFIFDLRKAIDS